jgi:hypothetical protein
MNGARQLFSGQQAAWEPATGGSFDKAGEVHWLEASVRLEAGAPATGIIYRGPLPSQWFRLELEARRLQGSDFFCGLTFPVADEYCSLILGGWGGGVTGFSCLDGVWAIDNETTGYTNFQNQQWYRVRVDVGPERLTALIDDRSIASIALGKHRLSVREEIEPALPMSITSWRTTAELRGLTLIEL